MIIMTIETELKTALGKNLVSLGSRTAVKLAKKNEASAIIVANNCPAEILSNLKKSGAKFETFSNTGKQLGIFCGKPFPVAVVAIKMEKKKK